MDILVLCIILYMSNGLWTEVLEGLLALGHKLHDGTQEELAGGRAPADGVAEGGGRRGLGHQGLQL